jgi:hypothetical protein
MNFRRIIAYVSVLAALAMPMAMAQSVPNIINSTPAENVSWSSGLFLANAYNYSGAVVYSGNASTGSASFTVRGGYVVLPDGRSVVPFAIGVPIVISDTTPELVTPTAVSGCYKSQGMNQDGILVTCTITASFASTHGAGAQVLSATNGVAEAAFDAFNWGGGTVVIGPGWKLGLNTSCTNCFASQNAVMAALLPFQSVSFMDVQGGTPVYWNLQGGATTLAAPATLTNATAGFGVNGANFTGGSYTGNSTYITCISYVDVMGQEGPCSATFTVATSGVAATDQIGYTAPAASAGAVGYTIYITLASGTYNLAYKVPLATYSNGAPTSTGVCTLTKIETTTAACSLTNANYGQTGVGAVVSALTLNTSPIEAQSTVVSTTSVYVPNAGGRTTYTYVPGSHIGITSIPAAFLPFTISAADATTVPSVLGTVNVGPNFMNLVGRTLEICGYATTTASTATIEDIQFQWDSVGQNTAGKGVPIGIMTATNTWATAGHLTFCEDFQTTVSGATATAGSIQNTGGFLTSTGVDLAAASGGGNTITGATASLNLASEARINVIYLHTTGTDGAALTLQSLTFKVVN